MVATKAGANEVANLEEVLEATDLPENIALKTDKGYQSKKNAAFLKRRKLKTHMLKRVCKNQLLTNWEQRFYTRIGKTRFKVECPFGSIKKIKLRIPSKNNNVFCNGLILCFHPLLFLGELSLFYSC